MDHQEEQPNLEQQFHDFQNRINAIINPPPHPQMRDHYNPAAVEIEPRINILAGPKVDLKPSMLHMTPKFHGLNSDDPF